MKSSSFVRKSVRSLRRPRYRNLPPKIIGMNDNSNLFMPNPVAKKVAKEFNFDLLAAYPSILSDELRDAIGEKFKIDSSQIIVGNGSDEIIDLTVKTYLNSGEKVAIPVPTFEMYSLYARIAGAKVVECPLKAKSFQLDVDKILSSKAKIIFLASPNNPTGNMMKEQDLLRIVKESDSIVVVDEAYIDFTSNNGLADAVNNTDNLMVMRTFSKAYALSGLRIGYGIGSKAVIDPIAAVCAPFRLNRFSERVAIEAIAEDEFVKKTAEMAKKERKWTTTELEKLGIKVFPSDTNFLLFKSTIPVKQLIKGLMKAGIAIRDCSNQPMLEKCARVTIGRHELNKKFIESMKGVLER